MTTRYYEFRVWCIVEARYIQTWGTQAPSVCPLNAAHAIDATKTTVLQSIEDQGISAKIVEEDPKQVDPTGGHYGAETWSLDIPAVAGWVEQDFSFPIPVALLSARWPNYPENEDDEVEVQIAPGTVIGSLTADAAIGVKTLSVSATVTANIKRGYYLTLSDGVQTEDLGRVVKVDAAAGTVEVENATTLAFLAATPTLVKQTVKMIPKGVLPGNWIVGIGEDKIGGSYLPANTKVRVRYRNIAGTQAKKLRVWIGYLY